MFLANPYHRSVAYGAHYSTIPPSLRFPDRDLQVPCVFRPPSRTPFSSLSTNYPSITPWRPPISPYFATNTIILTIWTDVAHQRCRELISPCCRVTQSVELVARPRTDASSMQVTACSRSSWTNVDVGIGRVKGDRLIRIENKATTRWFGARRCGTRGSVPAPPTWLRHRERAALLRCHPPKDSETVERRRWLRERDPGDVHRRTHSDHRPPASRAE